MCAPPRHAATSTTFPSSHAQSNAFWQQGPNKNTESPRVLFHRIPMRDRSPYPHNNLFSARPLSSRGILAWTPGGQEAGGDNHPLATCDFDMETNFVLNVVTRCLDRGQLSSRPLFVRFVRARRRYPFQATRSMESDNIAHTRGHSLHDEHPWVKTVQATLS